MKALTLTAIKSPLEIIERPSLEPAPGEVVVELKAAALNRRDYWITRGLYPGVAPPVVLGSDGAGIVKASGDGVDTEWLGREVLLNPGIGWGDNPSAQANDFTILGVPRDGTFADEVAVPVEQLAAKIEGLSWQEAAALPLAGVTAFRSLFTHAHMQADETVLITGIGGGVATLALQFAVAAGGNVWVTSSSDEKIAKAVELGARGGFDYSEENWAKQLVKEAGHPDVIIDSAGGHGYSDLINAAAPGGRIVNYGATAGPPQKLDLFKVFWKQVQLQGSTMGSPDDFAAMLAFATTHEIHPVIDRVMSLEEGNDAISLMQSSPQFGKIVLDVA